MQRKQRHKTDLRRDFEANFADLVALASDTPEDVALSSESMCIAEVEARREFW
jgi:hypothetical protein